MHRVWNSWIHCKPEGALVVAAPPSEMPRDARTGAKSFIQYETASPAPMLHCEDSLGSYTQSHAPRISESTVLETHVEEQGVLDAARPQALLCPPVGDMGWAPKHGHKLNTPEVSRRSTNLPQGTYRESAEPTLPGVQV